MKPSILLIEDDASTAAALAKVLCRHGLDVETCARGNDGLAQALQRPYDVVITDLKLPGLGGLDLVARLHEARPKLPIILITAHGTTDTAISAIRHGAFEYLLKPFDAQELLSLVSDAVQAGRLMSEPVELGKASQSPSAIIGNSRSMQALYKEVGRIAATPVSVLIRGETGTGKELIARAIYQHSDRQERPFIAVNCAAIPETLLESELFGHERGAFTGAQSRRIGRFEQAHGGTLFLDEIADLRPSTQAKLLRVLQERCIQRLGGDETIKVDVRIVAATHRDLGTAIKDREFREDLFYRLSVVTLSLPPLRERPEDIPDLVRFFIQRHAADLAADTPSIHAEALKLLQAEPWPGNVRELENVVREALLLAKPFGVGLDHVRKVLDKAKRHEQGTPPTHRHYVRDLLAAAQRGDVGDAYARMITDLEPELFRQAIELSQGNQAQAARWLGVTRLKMREKLSELGLHPNQGTEPDPTPPSSGNDNGSD